jgi:hypothetical protein
MSRLKKKERRRLKRKEKRKQAIRLRKQSPYGQLRSAGSVEACVINENWRESGQAVIHVLAHAPGYPPTMASFLVDLWCAGLKDVWGDLNVTSVDFRNMVDEMSDGTGLDFVSCELDLARSLIAGSIRFAHDNGFRLPARYERWLSVLGGVGDWSTADLSNFGIDGKLRWVGPMADLRRRLVGTRAEDFLAREDVEYIVGAEEGEMPDELAEAIDAEVQTLYEEMLNGVRRWCFANGEAPHPRLPEAVEITMEAILQVEDVGADEADKEEQVAAAMENVADMLALEAPQDARQLGEALEQVQRFASSFERYEDMLQAIGPDERDEEP